MVRLVALVSSVLVLLGFAAFAADESARASAAQVRQVSGDFAAEQRRERASGPVRELLDDANDVLLGPFEGMTTSRNPWVQRLIPTALALLLYGLGLSLLANYLPKARRTAQDWRTA